MTKRQHIIWNRCDVGRYADGKHGHQYVRNALADLLEQHADAIVTPFCGPIDIAAALRTDDNLEDVYAAIDLLLMLCADDVYWTLQYGDLMLLSTHSDDTNVPD